MKKSNGHVDPDHLRQSLGLGDLVLLNISCIVGLSSLAQVAQFGFASITLYFIAILTFLIPSGLMIAELNARMPGEGGFYLWTRRAFGDFHGYVAAWCYWVSNMVWLPTIMLLISLSCLYIAGDDLLYLSDNIWYSSIVCLGILWTVTLLNIWGLERAKWVQNLGGTAIWVCIAMLLIVGTVYVLEEGSVRTFEVGKLLPDFSDLSLIPFFAIVAFCFGGLELAPVLAGEVKNPGRNIPRAIVISSVIVGLLYTLGTLMLIFTIPDGEVGLVEGVAQAFHEMGTRMNMPYIGTVGAILVSFSALGLFGAWMTGTARIPFVVGLDHYFPDAFGKIHNKWGSPYISLLVQGVILTVLFMFSILGSSVEEAFLILLDMSIILYFIPFLYMFAAFAWHNHQDTGESGIISVFRTSKAAVWLVTVLGFGTTLFSVVISSVPTKDIVNKELFVLKVVGGAGLLISIGLIIYFNRRRALSQQLKPLHEATG